MTLSLASAEILRQRAAEDGVDMSAWVDRLIAKADLQRRIRADRVTLDAAGLLTPERDARNARIAAAMRAGR
ncbi:hypothetical protein Lfu02_76120 [Longispora fulva]|nr:hypothetical protein Lfu02_76120 [Longispora fulva]